MLGLVRCVLRAVVAAAVAVAAAAEVVVIVVVVHPLMVEGWSECRMVCMTDSSLYLFPLMS